MLFAGLDMGLSSVKAVVLDQEKPIASGTQAVEEDCRTTAEKLISRLLQDTGLQTSEIRAIVATGMGRKELDLARMHRTEQICVGRGAFQLHPSVRTVLDTGAGGCRALSLGERGKLLDFSVNSKCAGGTGSFLEAAGRVLHMKPWEMDSLAARAEAEAHVTSYCAVFAESEIISNIHRGYSIESICAGICRSVVLRMMDVLDRIERHREVLLCGGVARSRTVVRMCEALLGFPVVQPEDPDILGALGAALIARETAA